MEKRIVGDQQDEEQHWMAELECGHHQHLRHQPPWTNRPWVTSAEGRTSHLGDMLDCKKCEYGLPPDYFRCDAFRLGGGSIATLVKKTWRSMATGAIDADHER